MQTKAEYIQIVYIGVATEACYQLSKNDGQTSRSCKQTLVGMFLLIRIDAGITTLGGLTQIGRLLGIYRFLSFNLCRSFRFSSLATHPHPSHIIVGIRTCYNLVYWSFHSKEAALVITPPTFLIDPADVLRNSSADRAL